MLNGAALGREYWRTRSPETGSTSDSFTSIRCASPKWPSHGGEIKLQPVRHICELFWSFGAGQPPGLLDGRDFHDRLPILY